MNVSREQFAKVRQALNGLIGNRLDKALLIKHIDRLIEGIGLDYTYIHIVNETDIDDFEDYRIDFALEGCNIIGSIWYLKTRNKNKPYYITEISVDNG